MCFWLFGGLSIGTFNVNAACSPYIGRVTINEVDVHNQSGRSGPYFVELKALDNAIIEEVPPVFENWTLDICSVPGARDGNPCRRNIPVGAGLLRDNWLVIDQNIIGWNYLDLNDGRRHGMEMILYDENDDIVDYLSIDGYRIAGSQRCSFPYDTTYSGGNSFNIQRMPDGVGYWQSPGSGNSGGNTENDTNDPIPSNSPEVSVADGTAVAGEQMSFSVELSEASDEDIVIEYYTRNGTATSGDDYLSASGSLVIPAGTLTVDIVVDTLPSADGGSYFYLILGEVRSRNAKILNNLARGTILLTPLAEYRFENCDWTTGAVVIDERGNHNGRVVQGAHTAPGINFGGGICNVADLANEGSDFNRYISLADNPISLDRDWTLMMWINFPPGFDQHYLYRNYRYSVIAGGTHDLAWIREHVTTGARYWGASSSPTSHLAPFPSHLSGWHHVAFVGRGTNTELYVDGAFYNSVDYKQTGSYTRMGTSADSVSTYARQNLDTQLDELKFYDGALSLTEITNIYTLEKSGMRWNGAPLNCNLCGIVDHYRIEHSGSGLTCQSSDITVRACSDSNCVTEYPYPTTVTMLPASSHPPVWSGGDTQTFTGNGTVPLRQTTDGPVTLGLKDPDHVPTHGYRCYDSGVEGDCTIDFYKSGFIYSIPDLTACKTSSKISIQAVQADDTSQACIGDAGFADTTRTVSFWSDYLNPATGTNRVKVNGSNVDNNAPGSGVSLAFDSDAKAFFTVTYPDVGQLQLNALYLGAVGSEEEGLVMPGSDVFISRPVGLCVYSDDTNADCGSGNGSCSLFRKVDQDFSLKVKGVCWQSDGDGDLCSGNATTPNYQQNGINITHNLIAPTGTGSSAGDISVSVVDISESDEGEHTISDQAVSEVGVFTFTATPPDYFGRSIAAATSANIGRFSPDHFTTAMINNGSYQSACGGSFTYTGQPFGYAAADSPHMLITAVRASGGTTLNYRDDFVRLTDPSTQISMPAVTTDASTLGADGTALLNLTWMADTPILTPNNDGTLDFILGDDQFSYLREANALVAPFVSDIQLRVTAVGDSDGIVATDLPRSFRPTGTEIRYGRLLLQNAYGPETRALTIPVSVEYFNGAAFVPNGLDGCTSYNASELQLGPYQGNLMAGDTTASGSGSLISGAGNNLQLSAPGVGHDGTVQLSLDLSQATGLDLEWLRPGGVDPTAMATFGIFKGNPRLIYTRESIW